MKPMALRPRPLITRSASALWAASFLFFLLYSAPHQVHHFFDQFPQAHQHDADHEHAPTDRNNRSAADSNCVFQVSASRCHLGLAWQVIPCFAANLSPPSQLLPRQRQRCRSFPGSIPDPRSSTSLTDLTSAVISKYARCCQGPQAIRRARSSFAGESMRRWFQHRA